MIIIARLEARAGRDESASDRGARGVESDGRFARYSWVGLRRYAYGRRTVSVTPPAPRLVARRV